MVHELTHALRIGYGGSTALPVFFSPGPEWSARNLEEWFAQVVMNMYLLERGRPASTAYDYWYTARRSPRAAVLPPAASFRRARTEETAYDARLLTIARFEQMNMRLWRYHAPSLQAVFDAFAALPRDRVPYNPSRDAHVRHPRVLIPWSHPR